MLVSGLLLTQFRNLFCIRCGRTHRPHCARPKGRSMPKSDSLCNFIIVWQVPGWEARIDFFLPAGSDVLQADAATGANCGAPAEFPQEPSRSVGQLNMASWKGSLRHEFGLLKQSLGVFCCQHTFGVYKGTGWGTVLKSSTSPMRFRVESGSSLAGLTGCMKNASTAAVQESFRRSPNFLKKGQVVGARSCSLGVSSLRAALKHALSAYRSQVITGTGVVRWCCVFGCR